MTWFSKEIEMELRIIIFLHYLYYIKYNKKCNLNEKKVLICIANVMRRKCASDGTAPRNAREGAPTGCRYF